MSLRSIERRIGDSKYRRRRIGAGKSTNIIEENRRVQKWLAYGAADLRRKWMTL